jgi:excisionase family DNA binding protein
LPAGCPDEDHVNGSQTFSELLSLDADMTRKELRTLIRKRWEELERLYADEYSDPEKVVAKERATVYEVANEMAVAAFHRLHTAGLTLRAGDNPEAVKTYLSRCLGALQSKRIADADPQTEMLTPPQVARRYGVSPDTVRGWIASGDLRALSVGKASRVRYRVPVDALEEFAAKRPARVAPKAPPQRRRRRKVDLPFRRYS